MHAHNLARDALRAAPAFQPHGRWTPCTYPGPQRAAAASDIATAIRLNAHMLTGDERSELAAELIRNHSTDHTPFGDPS